MLVRRHFFTFLVVMLLFSTTVSGSLLAISNGQDDDANLTAMTVAELKRFISERGASCTGCIERADLEERVIQVRHLLTVDERVVSELTPIQTSATTHLVPQHISSIPQEMVDKGYRFTNPYVPQTGGQAALEALNAPSYGTIDAKHSSVVLCTGSDDIATLVNGTRSCAQFAASQAS